MFAKYTIEQLWSLVAIKIINSTMKFDILRCMVCFCFRVPIRNRQIRYYWYIFSSCKTRCASQSPSYSLFWERQKCSGRQASKKCYMLKEWFEQKWRATSYRYKKFLQCSTWNNDTNVWTHRASMLSRRWGNNTRSTSTALQRHEFTRTGVHGSVSCISCRQSRKGTTTFAKAGRDNCEYRRKFREARKPRPLLAKDTG